MNWVRMCIFLLLEELQQIKQQYIWIWVLDVDNIHKQEVLEYYDLFIRQ